MRASTIVRIICWSLVAVILSMTLWCVIDDRDDGRWFPNFNFGWNANHIVDDNYDDNYNKINGDTQSVDAASINSLEIDWINGNIKIEKSESGEIVFSEKSNKALSAKEKMVYAVDNGTLKIKTDSRTNSVRISNTPSKDLTVYLPKDLADLSIDNVSANVEISNINAAEFSVDNVSGKVKASGMKSSEVDINTVSGAVNLSGAFGKISTESVSASCDVSSAICPSDIDIDTVSGGIKILIPDNDGFTIKNDSLSGSINSDFQGTMSKRSFVYKNGAARFQIDSVSGSVTVNKLV